MPGDGSVQREPFAIGDLPIGRAMDEALALTKRHGWQAAMVGIVPVLPISIAFALVSVWLGRSSALGPVSRTLLFDLPWESLVGGLVSTPLEAGMIYLFAVGYLGKPATIGEGYRHAASCWWRVGPIYVLLIAMILLGTMACILPGLLLVTALFLHLPVMALEGSGPWAAFGRAFALLQGRMLIIFLVVCLTIALGAGMRGIADFMGPPYLTESVYRVLIAPVNLYLSALAAVIYISARSRHEAIDLQLLADNIAAEADDEAPIRL